MGGIKKDFTGLKQDFKAMNNYLQLVISRAEKYKVENLSETDLIRGVKFVLYHRAYSTIRTYNRNGDISQEQTNELLNDINTYFKGQNKTVYLKNIHAFKQFLKFERTGGYTCERTKEPEKLSDIKSTSSQITYKKLVERIRNKELYVTYEEAIDLVDIMDIEYIWNENPKGDELIYIFIKKFNVRLFIK